MNVYKGLSAAPRVLSATLLTLIIYLALQTKNDLELGLLETTYATGEKIQC